MKRSIIKKRFPKSNSLPTATERACREKPLQRNRFYLFLFTLIGIGLASCSAEDAPCEYGSPYVEFEVNGKVVDEASNPIAQIEVRLEDPAGWEPAVTRTAADGTFTLNQQGGFDFDQLLEIVATDTDGPENGGSFATMKTTIRTQKSDFKDPERWSQGKATYNLLLELNKEESGK